MKIKNSSKSVFQLRVQKQIHHVMLDVFNKSEMSLNDKRFFLNVTNVDISPDLKNLKIFIDILDLDSSNKEKVIKNLNKNHAIPIRRILAERVNLKFVPEVIFILDNSGEKLHKINSIIEKEKNKFENN